MKSQLLCMWYDHDKPESDHIIHFIYVYSRTPWCTHKTFFLKKNLTCFPKLVASGKRLTHHSVLAVGPTGTLPTPSIWCDYCRQSHSRSPNNLITWLPILVFYMYTNHAGWYYYHNMEEFCKLAGVGEGKLPELFCLCQSSHQQTAWDWLDKYIRVSSRPKQQEANILVYGQAN